VINGRWRPLGTPAAPYRLR